MNPIHFWRDLRRHQRSYATEAEELFSRFATRHQLSYHVTEAGELDHFGVDLLWKFPEQDKLTLPITLGLQNNDELNFGAPAFWSYFFPYPTVCSKFEAILDAWVEGRARIARDGILRGCRLQVLGEDGWTTIYTARGSGKWETSGEFVQNERPPAAKV
jgi:hypothetical protein